MDEPQEQIEVPQMVRRENSPGAISDNSGTIAQGGTATLNDRLGVYFGVIALMVATLALGMVLERGRSDADTQRLQDQVIDSKIRAGVADAVAQANEAKVKARVAEDDVKSICAALKVSGHKNVDCH
jgi:hypothetical protein